MDLDRFTLKAQEATSSARSAGGSRGHPEITPEHLFARARDAGGRHRSALLDKIGVPPAALADELEAELQSFRTCRGTATSRASPRRSRRSSTSPRRSPGSSRRLRRRRAPPPRRSSRRKVEGGEGPDEHGALRGLAPRRAEGGPRGSARVTDQDAEDKYQALKRYCGDLTALARRGKARPRDRPRRRDPPRHAGPDAAGRRTTPSSSANRASARPPSSRASRGASSRGDVPESLKDKTRPRARPRRPGRGRQVPRRVRGAAEGRREGGQGPRARSSSSSTSSTP